MQTSMSDFPLSAVGWFYPYDSILQPLFDKYMLELFENGVFNRIVDTIHEKQPDCPAETVPKVNFSFVIIIFSMHRFTLISFRGTLHGCM